MSELKLVNAMSYEKFIYKGRPVYKGRGFSRKIYALSKRFNKKQQYIQRFFTDIVGNIWQQDKIFYKIDLNKFKIKDIFSEVKKICLDIYP